MLRTPEEYLDTIRVREVFQERLMTLQNNPDPKRAKRVQDATENEYRSKIADFDRQLREYEEMFGVPELPEEEGEPV